MADSHCGKGKGSNVRSQWDAVGSGCGQHGHLCAGQSQVDAVDSDLVPRQSRSTAAGGWGLVGGVDLWHVGPSKTSRVTGHQEHRYQRTRAEPGRSLQRRTLATPPWRRPHCEVGRDAALGDQVASPAST